MGFEGTPRISEETDWSEVDDSGANAAVTITHAAEAGKRHYITGFEAVVSGAVLGNDVEVELLEGATVRWRTFLGSGLTQGERSGIMLQRPIRMGVNAAVALSAAAGGAAAVITVNLGGYTI